MISNTVAYLIARSFFTVAIYEQLLHQDGLHLPAEQRVAATLSTLLVRDAMTTALRALPAEQSTRDAHQRVSPLPFTMFPVVDKQGTVQGVVSQSRLERRIAGGQGAQPVAQFAQVREYLHPHATLLSAVVRMDQLGARQMLVVDDDKRPVGMLAMSDVMRAYASVAGPETHPRWSEVRLPAVPAADETGSFPPSEAPS